MTDKVARVPRSAQGGTDRIAIATIVVLACQAWLLWFGGLNWDEFHHYNLLRRLDEGTLDAVLQTFFTRLFQWLLWLPGDVVDHVRAARLIMFLCEIGIAAAIYGLARSFAAPQASALAALTYLTAGFVTTQAFSFRFDPMAGLVMMSGMYLISKGRMSPWRLVLLGGLIGLSVMVTIKVILYAPAVLAVIWATYRSSRGGARFLRDIAVAFALGGIVFLVLHAWHAADTGGGSAVASMRGSGSAGRMVFSDGFFPRFEIFVLQVLMAPHVALLVLAAIVTLPWLDMQKPHKVLALGMLAPLLTLLVYRNAYGYFYVFLLPPVLVACAPVLDRITPRRLSVSALSIFLAVWGALMALKFIPAKTEILIEQKALIATAHQIFPERVAYFDDVGVLGDYERVFAFMPTGVGLKAYRDRGHPIFREAMARKPIPLLIANSHVFQAEMQASGPNGYLLDADARALDENYIHHWGPFWVAGKHIPPDETELDIKIPGPYTVESAPLRIDGTTYAIGEVMRLERGLYRIDPPRGAATTLRWGENLHRPAAPEPANWPFVPHSGP